MGISIDIWRARIGTYGGSGRCNSNEMHAIFLDSTNVKFFLAVLTMCLVIGNIEKNPGPESYRCQRTSCNFVASSLTACALHQQVHQYEKNFNFRCPLVPCWNKVFKTYSGLSNHIKEFHPKKSVTTTSEDSSSCGVTACNFSCETRSELCRHYVEHLQNNIVLKCPLCRNTRNFSDADKFGAHFTGNHTEYDNSQVKCNVSGCRESFSSIDDISEHFKNHLAGNMKLNCPLHKGCHVDKFSDSQIFRTHLSVKHSGWKDDNSPISKRTPTNSHNASSSGSMHQSMEIDDCADHGSTGNPSDSDIGMDENPITADMFFSQIAQFYFMLLSEQLLPDSTVDTIARGLKLMSELVQHQYRVALTRELKNRGIKEEEINDVINSVMNCDVFYAAHHKKSPGPTFTSVHLRNKYLESSLNYVKPIDVHLDDDVDDGAVAQLIPPADVLDALLKDPLTQQYILKSFERESDPNVIADYTDGSACRCKGVRERIDIHMFQDAFNPVKNPLGSAKNKHKRNGTYWTIGNLPPHVRAKTDSINLAYIVEQKYLQDTKNYGPHKCFKPLIDKLKTLESEGIEFMGRRIPVVIQYYTGDSLGAHEIGGFIGQFSSTYFCRFCEIKREDFLRHPWTVRIFRTKESYNAALHQLEEIRSRRPDTVTFRGVKKDSILHELKDFHVCDPRLPPCVAHDVFEGGVADHDLSEIISCLVKEDWFSYQDLNNLLNAFQCHGPDKGNKPAPVKDNGEKLGGHAIQNWTLVRLLPFIIQDHIQDTSHRIWNLYLKLKRLLEYACAPSFSPDDIFQLKQLSTDYMKSRQELLQKPPKPKHHLFMHYADLIPFVGPIIYLFTMRFEAKHQFF